jgi:tRNA A-37 threonylcarbamoyl transferase component Bud32
VDFPDIGDAADVARRLPQFEILSLLGQGGMGVVYKARQPQLDRIVALKILPPVDALSPDFVERFRREARALAKLSHPNIVTVHECGEQGGLYYFVMEYVDGANLRTLLEAKTLTPIEALAIVPKVCDALEYAHEEGVIHRDIKPENLLIDKKGRVKIADFGLAKLLRREAMDVSLTVSGTSLGTLRYMAPEQMEKPESVDHRADIYSLGVVFYEMLTGEVPMGRFAPPSEKVQVDVKLDEIVLHALERDVERRYQHASEVKTAVESVTQPAPAAPVREPQPGAQAEKPVPESKAVRAPGEILLLLAGVSLLMAVGIQVWLATWLHSNPDRLKISAPGMQPTLMGMSATLAAHGLFIGIAGWLLRKLRARMFVMIVLVLAGLLVPAALAVNMGMEYDLIPQWPLLIPLWLAMPVCVWAITLLFRDDVREAFTTAPGAPMSPAPARFLRSLLWLAVVIGTVMFIWFDAHSSWRHPEDGGTVTTMYIGAVQPWLEFSKQSTRWHTNRAPDFLTVSGLAGIGALIALLALFSFRPPKSSPSTPQVLAQIRTRGILIASLAGLAACLWPVAQVERGFGLATMAQDSGKVFDAPAKVRVGDVAFGTPMDKAGVRAGDEIVSFGGRKALMEDFDRVWMQTPVGGDFEITVLRDGKELVLRFNRPPDPISVYYLVFWQFVCGGAFLAVGVLVFASGSMPGLAPWRGVVAAGFGIAMLVFVVGFAPTYPGRELWRELHFLTKNETLDFWHKVATCAAAVALLALGVRDFMRQLSQPEKCAATITDPARKFTAPLLSRLAFDSPIGLAATVTALAALCAHKFQWQSLIVPGNQVLSPANSLVVSCKVSVAMLVLSVISALFGSVRSLTTGAKRIIRGVACIFVVAALWYQVSFYLTLGKWEPGQEGRTLRMTQSYAEFGFHATIVLTSLALLLFVVRLIEEFSSAKHTDDAADGEPRLSRCALIGVLWAPWTLTGWWAWQHCVRQYFDRPEVFATYSAGYVALGVTVFVLAATAPIASTILGGVAIAQIKRSNGKLYGLPMAACALLAHPLLLVGSLAFWLTNLVAFAIAFNLRTPPALSQEAVPHRGLAVIDFVVLDSLAALAVMFFAGRAAWRKISGVVPEPKAPRAPGAWTPLEITAASTTALAFLLGAVNAIFDLAHRTSPIHGLTLGAILLGAVCVAAQLVTQQFRQASTPARASLPELAFPALAACSGGLWWTSFLSGVPGWTFWHGAGFAVLNFLLALFLLITGGAGLAKTRAILLLLAGIAGLALVLWWNAVPVQVIGSTSGMTFTRKGALAGVWTAAALAVLTAITGALRLRAALAGGGNAVSSPGKHEPSPPLLEARISAARTIATDSTRNDALRAIAINAAGNGDALSSKAAIEAMTFVDLKDDTAATCAKTLARTDVAAATGIAKLIASNELHDATLGAIAQGAAPTP